MKKFLSLILAALVITAAGCSGNDAAATTTTTAEAEATTTTTAAETTTTEATTTTAETTTTPAVTEEIVDNPLMTEEMVEFITELKSKSPIYGEFIEITSTIPLHLGMAYEADMTGTGAMSSVSMDLYISSLDKMFISTISDGVAADILFNNGKYYIISAEEKTALYIEMSDEEAADLANQMTASVKANFDASDATYEAGETEYNGTTYLYEKVTTDELGDILVYADTATKKIKYLSNQDIMMEITALESDFDESIYEVPSDYAIIDMSALMGGSDDSLTDDNTVKDKDGALETATDYLTYSAFSYDSLVEQLEFEGFSHEDAVYAADNCGADWAEQAEKAAATYIEYSAFSYNGLIEMLEYEGYSSEDAKNAVDKCGADWKEQALASATSYLEFSNFSYAGLVEQLGYEGFTADEAAYGVDNCGADWNEQAVAYAKETLEFNSEYTREDLLAALTDRGFTAEQAAYGVEACGL